MKEYATLFICLVSMAFPALSQQKIQPLELWYNQPSKVWEEALPLGNGTTGAMVYGGINREQFALNDHTLWSGYPNPGNKPKGPEILPKVREAIFNGDYDEAGKLWKGLHGPYSDVYLTMGDLFLKFGFPDTLVENYTRKLDLRTAVSTIGFTRDKVNYKRESFISFPDQVMVVKLTSSEQKKISFEAILSSKLHFTVRVVAPDYLVLTGKAPKHVAHRAEEPQQIVYDEAGGEGMNFEIHLKLISKGGSLISSNNSIGIKNADEAVLLMTEATSPCSISWKSWPLTVHKRPKSITASSRVGWHTTTPISGPKHLPQAAKIGTRKGRRAGRPGRWPGPGSAGICGSIISLQATKCSWPKKPGR